MALWNRFIRTVKEKYKEKYGGGEYRARRIRELRDRAREEEARARLARARAKQQHGTFSPDYSFITGAKKKRKGNAWDHLLENKRL